MNEKSKIIDYETKFIGEGESSSQRYLNLLLYFVGFSILLLFLQRVLAVFILDSTKSLVLLNLIFFATFSALTFLIQRILLNSGLGLGYDWNYRLALIASSGLGICFWLLPQVSAITCRNFSFLTSAIGGAFAGALIVTGVDSGLVEVNLPPPREVKEQVRQQHQELLGGSFPENRVKYYSDTFLSVMLLILSMPVCLAIAFLIWWEDPGPIFFIKNSVGRRGINFLQLKFRTMVRNAEKETGPVLAALNDKRMLIVGRFLRKMALDELPQIINILRGEMSFVGPRPQRTVLVYDYLKDIPKYALRHRVRPGLAGLGQVAGHYYVTPLQKLRFDRIYVRHMSLRFDLKILLCAFLVVFWLRWRNDWNGRLPPWLLES
jgi:lipopolysaccharide/colanic/teichoic acid biosynthesis glycosyltransferase